MFIYTCLIAIAVLRSAAGSDPRDNEDSVFYDPKVRGGDSGLSKILPHPNE